MARKQTTAEKARKLKAAEPELTTTEIMHRIGANSHQQVQAALRAEGKTPGRKRRWVKVEFEPEELALVSAEAKKERKTVEDWLAHLAMRTVENRRESA